MSGVYVGDRQLEPADEALLIRCTYCRAESHSKDWRANRGHCPLCQKAYAGEKNED